MVRLPVYIAVWRTTKAPFLQQVALLGRADANIRPVEQNQNASAALPLSWAVPCLAVDHEALLCRMDSAKLYLALASCIFFAGHLFLWWPQNTSRQHPHTPSRELTHLNHNR